MSEKTDAWMPLWIGSYLADTQRLTRDQHGGYLLLIMDYWRNGPPPDDDDVLMTVAKASPSEWKKLRPVLANFFRISDGKWFHKRIEEELEQACRNKKTKQEKASSGGARRWASEDGEAAERGRHLRSQRIAEARKKGTHTADQWEAMKSFHQCLCVRCGAGGEMVKDHIKPIYQGGSDGIENIQPLCRSCNASKGPETSDLRKHGWENAINGGVQEGIREGIREGIQEGSKRLLDACPTPSPIKRHSEANASGASPPQPMDPTKAIFDLGVAVLGGAGMAEKQARSLVGKLRKAVGDDQAMAVLVSAKATTDPAAYIGAAMRPDPVADEIRQRMGGARVEKLTDGRYRSGERYFNSDGSTRVRLC